MGLAPPTRLGPYEAISPLGVGGLGEAYGGRPARLDRTVALKILPESFSTSPESWQRFGREARALGRLAHPNNRALFGVGSAERVEYLVVELLESETPVARLGRDSLPLGQMLCYGKEIAGALDAARRTGTVHRDKPGNLHRRQEPRFTDGY